MANSYMQNDGAFMVSFSIICAEENGGNLWKPAVTVFRITGVTIVGDHLC